MLSEQDKRILMTVIESYLGDRTPVSSMRVLERGGYDVSPATIRNRLAGLEQHGYLVKMHTSSGRIPTDEGYRVYVDELAEGGSRVAVSEIAMQCRRELREYVSDVGRILLRASRFLGSMSRNFAIVYGTIEGESVVRSINLFKLDQSRLLIVVNLNPEHEKTAVLRFDREFSDEVVATSQALINRVLASKTLSDARAALSDLARDNVTDEGVIVGEVTANRQLLFAEPPAVELFFEERNHGFEQPELSDPKNLQLLLKLLHNKPYLTSVLSSRSLDRTEVTIGHENADEGLYPFSIVTSGYRMGAASGVLGIIGPTRMRYDLAMALVNSVSREIRAIGEEYF